MSELKNVFTRGTEGINLTGDSSRSMVNLPANEDYSMIVLVESVLNGVVSGVKIWDTGGKIFFARLEYRGRPGTPPDNVIFPGQHIVFYRVGDFNSPGIAGYELHEEDPSNCSFVCFVSPGLDTIYVEDLGGGNGRQVEFDDTGQTIIPPGSETLAIKGLETIANYHNGTYPSAQGRIFPAQKLIGATNRYIAGLPGFGNHEESFENEDGIGLPDLFRFYLSIDGSGHILDFDVVFQFGS